MDNLLLDSMSFIVDNEFRPKNDYSAETTSTISHPQGKDFCFEGFVFSFHYLIENIYLWLQTLPDIKRLNCGYNKFTKQFLR